MGCFCGSPEFSAYLKHRTRWGPVQIVRCVRCQAYRAAQIPDAAQQENLYTGDVIYKPPTEEKFNQHKGKFRDVAAELQRIGIRPGRLLEVGSNAGYALEAFREFGWDVTGCEQNVATSNYARERLNVRVVHSVGELACESFDLIFLSHVLEHVMQPRTFLRLVSEHLSSQGLMCILVPNYGSLYVRHVFRHTWAGYLPLQHIWYFDSESLTNLLRLVGLAPIRLKTRGFISWRSRNIAVSLVKAPIAGLQRVIPNQGDEIFALFRLVPARCDES